MLNLQLYNKIFFDNPLPMALISIEDRGFLEINSAFIEKTGYTEKEILNKTFEELVISLEFVDTETLENTIGEIEKKDQLIRCKDGSLLNGEISLREIVDREKNLLLMVIVDMTDSIECRKKLENKFIKLASVIEGTNLGTWEWEIKTGQIGINRKWANMLGYSLKELQPVDIEKWNSLVHPEDIVILKEQLKRHLNDESECYDCEIRIRHKNGNWVWIQDIGKILERDSHGVAVKMFGTHLDITEKKEAEQALQESEKRFSLALEKSKAGLWDMDLVSGDVFLSPLWKNILGYEDYEIENSFKSWKQLWHPDDKENIEKSMNDYLEGNSDIYELIYRMKHKDGSWKWILTSGGLLWDESGSPYRWVGTNIDITKEHEQSIELERFFSINLDLLCILDMEGNFIKTNKAWEDVLGYSSKELKGKNLLDFVYKEDYLDTLNVIEVLKAGDRVTSYTNRYISIDGYYHYIEWRLNPYEGVVYGAARDITERIEYEEKILEISNRDPLTNVYNRRYIFNRLEEIIEEHKRTGKVFSVCIIDLDHFKAINDKHGHQTGDRILIEFTRIIGEGLRPYDILGRYGGEEFIIVLNNANENQSVLVIERLLETVRDETFIFGGEDIKLTFSAGISCTDELEKHEITIEKLVLMADNRMYQGKNTGRNKIIHMKNNQDDTKLEG